MRIAAFVLPDAMIPIDMLVDSSESWWYRDCVCLGVGVIRYQVIHITF